MSITLEFFKPSFLIFDGHCVHVPRARENVEAVYVDGFNLFFGIRSKNPKAVNFDVASYVQGRLGSNQRLASVRYYSAP